MSISRNAALLYVLRNPGAIVRRVGGRETSGYAMVDGVLSNRSKSGNWSPCDASGRFLAKPNKDKYFVTEEEVSSGVVEVDQLGEACATFGCQAENVRALVENVLDNRYVEVGQN